MSVPTPKSPPSKLFGALYAVAAGVLVYETVRAAGVTPNLTMIGLFVAEAFGVYVLDTANRNMYIGLGGAAAASFSSGIALATITTCAAAGVGVFEIGAAMLALIGL